MPNDDLDAYLDPAPKPRPQQRPTQPHLNDLIGFAKENQLTVGSTTGGRHNAGSRHYTGNAIDIRNSGGFDNATVSRLSNLAASRGFTVRDERVRPKGQAVWGGPHIHIEYTGLQEQQQKPSGDLDQYLDSVSAPTPTKSPAVSRQPSVPSNALDQLTASSTKGIERIGRRAKPAPSGPTLQLPTVDKTVPRVDEMLTGRPRVNVPREPASMSARTPSTWEKVKETVAPYVPGLSTLDTAFGVKTDPIRGAASGLTLGAVGDPRQVGLEERIVDPEAQAKADTAHTVGSFAPALVPYLAAEKVLGAIPLLAQEGRVANIARTALTFGGVELGREGIRAAKTDTPLDPKEVAISTAIGAAMGGLSGVNPSLKRRLVAFVTPQAVADAARGTDPQQAVLNALTNLGFGLAGGRAPRDLEARLKNAEAKEVPTTELDNRQGGRSEGVSTSAKIEGLPSPDTSAPRRWQHTDFGEVTESPNQKRIGRGRVRVTDAEGVDHVIKKAALTGAGNQRAIPIKEAPVEPDLEGYLDKPDSQLQQSSGENLPPVDRGAAEAGTPPVAETTPAVEAQTVSTPAEPSTTSARQKQFAKDRAELDLPELPAPERKSWQISLDEAQPERANTLADEVLSRPRPLNDTETASLVVRAQEIKNRHSEVMKEIGDATEPDVIAQKRAEADALQNEFDKLTEATKKSGTEKGRTLAAQKLTINQDFDLVSMKQRAKAAKGRELTPEENARYEKMSSEIESLKTQLADAQAKQVEKNFQKEITKISKQRSRKETRKALDDEFVDLRAQFAQARAQIKNVQASGLAGIDPEGTLTKIVIKMAHNRAKAGTVEAKALVSEIYNAVKEHVDDLTERDIRDAISGYSIAPKTTRTELQKRLDEIRSELQGMSKTEDIEAGVRSPRREGPSPSEARRLPMEGPRQSEARSSGIPLQGPHLSDVRQLPAEGPKLSEGVGRKQGPRLTEAPLQGPRLSDIRRVPEQGPQMVQHGPEKRLFTRDATRRAALEKEGAEIERRLRERDFSSKPKKEPIVYSRETQRVSDRIAKLKSEYERELEREKGLFWQNLSGMRKAWMLSGLKTQARNIAGTGGYQIFDEVSRMPAAIADALASTVTGQRSASGSSPSAMLDSVLHAVKEGGRETQEIMKLGATKEQLERQQLKEINTGSKVIDTVHNTIFRFMSASDRVFYQQAYRRNLLDRATAQARTERASNVRERARELADKPTAELEESGKHDALVATFNNSNKLSDAIRRGRSALGPKANFAIDLVLPFDRTPTNVIARVLEASPVGYAKNAKQLANAIVKRSMSVEDQRQFSQTFGRATTGTALLALGWYLAPKNVITTDEFGNAYLNVAGRKMNLTSLSPVGNLLGVGANLYAAAHKDKGKGRAIAGAIAKPVSDLPILRSTSDLGEVIKDPERSGVKSGARLAGSFIPFSGALRDSAQFLDPEEKRSPKTFTDQIKANLPKLRESVPVSNSPLFAGKTVSTPAIKEAQRLGMRLVGIQISPKETPEEYEARRAKIVPVMQRELDELVGSAEYKAKSDKDKQIAIKTKIQDVNDSYQRQNPKPRERRQRRQKEQYQFQ